MTCTTGMAWVVATTPWPCSTWFRAGRSTVNALPCNEVDVKIVVIDANLVPHRERLETNAPPGSDIRWHIGGVSPDDLRDADVFVGSRFTADMARAADKLRLIHVAGAGTDKIDFASLRPDVLVANTFHHERSIAEYVVASAVMLRRGFLIQDRKLRD